MLKKKEKRKKKYFRYVCIENSNDQLAFSSIKTLEKKIPKGSPKRQN
jgi:hypothetical protein